MESMTLKSYIRQFGDLDQPLEVHHISGFIEEGLEAAGHRATESSTSQIHLKTPACVIWTTFENILITFY